MRWVHLAIVVLFAVVTLALLVQNREIVSVDLFGFSVRAPLAVIAAGFYLLGAVTGGSAYALLRRSVQGARATAGPTALTECMSRLFGGAKCADKTGDRQRRTARSPIRPAVETVRGTD